MADYKSIFKGSKIDEILSSVAYKQDIININNKLDVSLINGLDPIALSGSFDDLKDVPIYVLKDLFDTKINELETLLNEKASITSVVSLSESLDITNSKVASLEARPILNADIIEPTPIPNQTIIWVKPK